MQFDFIFADLIRVVQNFDEMIQLSTNVVNIISLQSYIMYLSDRQNCISEFEISDLTKLLLEWKSDNIGWALRLLI